MRVTIIGLPHITDALGKYVGAGRAIARFHAYVEATAPYARYVHEGARGRAGRPFLTDALAEVRPTILPILARAIPEGEAATERALQDVTDKVEVAAKRNAPYRTGFLRSRIQSRLGAR